MSSFKRKASGKQTPQLPGTRPSPASPLTTITSTGIPSLDDILGGGLPLSSSLLILAPDSHSSYGELVQKYFIAQGLVSGQDVCVIDDNAHDLVKGCMWLPGSTAPTNPLPSRTEAATPDSAVTVGDGADDGDPEEPTAQTQQDVDIKIAWRYGQMKQFQTTVAASSTPSAEEFCRGFDLASRIPQAVIQSALDSKQLCLLDIDSECSDEEELPMSRVLRRLEQILTDKMDTSASSPSPLRRTPLRICIPSLGAPGWGDLTGQDILRFLHSLRSLLRRHPHTCASLALAPHLSSDSWEGGGGAGAGWVQKLGWLSDGAITLSAFTANPSLSALFPSHHGLVDIHTLPSPHTLLPPSDKFSMLRGLSSSAASSGGTGENNLAFKCTRKRLIFETMHLDLEGGVGERRTTPSTSAVPADTGNGVHHDPNAEGTHSHSSHSHGTERPASKKAAFANVEIELEDAYDDPRVEATTKGILLGGGVKKANKKGVGIAEDASVEIPLLSPASSQKKAPTKPKRKVAFHSDRPELYDF